MVTFLIKAHFLFDCLLWSSAICSMLYPLCSTFSSANPSSLITSMLLTSLLLLRYLALSSKSAGLNAAILYAMARPSLVSSSLSPFLLDKATKLALLNLLRLPSLPSSMLLMALRSVLLRAFLNDEPSSLSLNALAATLDSLLILHGANDPHLRSRAVKALLLYCCRSFTAMGLQD